MSAFFICVRKFIVFSSFSSALLSFFVVYVKLLKLSNILNKHHIISRLFILYSYIFLENGKWKQKNVASFSWKRKEVKFMGTVAGKWICCTRNIFEELWMKIVIINSPEPDVFLISLGPRRFQNKILGLPPNSLLRYKS